MYLEIVNLNKTYINRKAVEDFSLCIEHGELIAILGPSGCGKTTTLQMIGGFIQPDSGKIILEGKNITGFAPNLRPTSTVFQKYALFPHMSVFENIIYGLKFKKISKKEARKKAFNMLETVGLSDLYNNNISQLSGGQQQRVALARALIINPKILLLDEPLSNLDANLRIKMRKEIKTIHKKIGITTLFVTHDQEEALSISDRIVVMNNGKIIQKGTPERIYRTPDNIFTACFLGETNRIKNKKSNEVALVRPENIMLYSHNNGTGSKGTIINRQFMGSYTIYVFKSGDNQINAHIKEIDNQGWVEGDTIYYHYPEKMVMKIKE